MVNCFRKQRNFRKFQAGTNKKVKVCSCYKRGHKSCYEIRAGSQHSGLQWPDRGSVPLSSEVELPRVL